MPCSANRAGTPLGGEPNGGALAYPEVQDALKLTAQQKKTLRLLVIEVNAALANEPVVNFEVSAKYCKIAADGALRLLTDEQTKAWKKMAGEPFEYTNDHYRLEKGEYKKVEGDEE